MLIEKYESRLLKSKFRIINELLCKEKIKNFDRDVLKTYYDGYTLQLSKWPENPVDKVIEIINKIVNEIGKGGDDAEDIDSRGKKPLIVADVGCGDGKISQYFQDSTMIKVINIDRYPVIKGAIKSDIDCLKIDHLKINSDGEIVRRNLKVGKTNKNSAADKEMLKIDICVYCLSLMKRNCFKAMCEANRVLIKGGYMIIAEVGSRIKNKKAFVNSIEKIGFESVNIKNVVSKSDNKNQVNNKKDIKKQKGDLSDYFEIFIFRKTKDVKCEKNGEIILDIFKYKRR